MVDPVETVAHNVAEGEILTRRQASIYSLSLRFTEPFREPETSLVITFCSSCWGMQGPIVISDAP